MKTIVSNQNIDQDLGMEIIGTLSSVFPEFVFAFDERTNSIKFDPAGNGGSRANVYIIQQKFFGFVLGYMWAKASKGV